MQGVQGIPTFTDGVFQLDGTHGFLPMQDPIRLNDKYSILDRLLQLLPQHINHPYDSIYREVSLLPNYIQEIKNETNKLMLVALYRGYCFVSSAYLLYPSHIHYKKTGKYGQARDILPLQLSQPLLFLADKLEVHPWLEYSYGYSLCNYKRKNFEGGLGYENLEMVNCFSGTEDETGFIMVHVDINQHSPSLLKNCDQLYTMFKTGSLNKVERSLQDIISTLKLMNTSRKRMWEASRWKHYNDFRVYIMGITGNQEIFPNGVVYSPESSPRYYRGQSGSQDSIIPFLDNFFRVCDFYPDNALTQYLENMRQYRPKPFRELLEWTKIHSIGLPGWLVDNGFGQQLIDIYKEIYEFRNGHWQFVQKYIMANTKYPIATGGTPIISWLPNQIEATLDAMKWVMETCHIECKEYTYYMEVLRKQKEILKQPDYDADQVYETNT